MGQIGANATKAENQSVAEMNAQHATLIQEIDTPTQCGPGLPCSDGSCCNSVGHDIAFRAVAVLTHFDRKENAALRLTTVKTQPL